MRINAFIVFICCLLVIADAKAEEQEELTIRIGVSVASFAKINQNDAKSALKAWAETVVREQKLQVKPILILYETFEDLKRDFVQNRLDAASFTIAEFMLLPLKPNFVYIVSTPTGITVRYALVVRQDSGINGINDLSDRRLVTHETVRMFMVRPWLKSIIADHVLKKKVLTNLEYTDSPSKAILQVFFRQKDAAIVTVEAFELVCELNPQLKKDMKVIAVSQPLVPACFSFNPYSKGKSRQVMEQALSELHTTPGGRQVLNVFQSSKIDKYPYSILDETIQFLAKYGDNAQKSKPKGAKP